MGCSDFDARFVTLRNGPVVPAAAYLLLLDLERREFELARDGSTLIVRPPERLTAEDRAAIRAWKHHLLMLMAYTPDDSHLFADVSRKENPPMRDVTGPRSIVDRSDSPTRLPGQLSRRATSRQRTSSENLCHPTYPA